VAEAVADVDDGFVDDAVDGVARSVSDSFATRCRTVAKPPAPASAVSPT
jgi:hypothetical protein